MRILVSVDERYLPLSCIFFKPVGSRNRGICCYDFHLTSTILCVGGRGLVGVYESVCLSQAKHILETFRAFAQLYGCGMNINIFLHIGISIVVKSSKRSQSNGK